MHPNMDHYSELGVTPQAEPDVIRAAYRALALRYHPDRQTTSHQAVSDKMARINRAYSVLSQAASRRAYDASLVRSAHPFAPSPSKGANNWAAQTRWAEPVVHGAIGQTLARSVQPYLTTYDHRGRLHAFV
jgi:DnaJ-class molecular chaperone